MINRGFKYVVIRNFEDFKTLIYKLYAEQTEYNVIRNNVNIALNESKGVLFRDKDVKEISNIIAEKLITLKTEL